MTLSELHPDELLWRDACGTLTPDERADLTAHLRRCPGCALERVVRLEAARARVPSEADHALAARLVDRVLATHERRPVMAIRAGWRRSLAAAAALVVLVAGTAFAATALVVRARAQRATRPLASAVAEPSAWRRAPEAGAAVRPPDTIPAPDMGAPSGDVRTPSVVSPPRERRPLRETSRPRQRPLRSNTLAHAASGLRAAPPHPEQPAPARAAESASSPLTAPPIAPVTAVVEPPQLEAQQLLRRAEQARTARHWADASRAFVDLGRRYPGTREEIVGRALYGQLLLDHLGEPRRALTMFERYLAVERSGALAEEARLGRAQALRTLGRSGEERSAWRELLREHPGSVHVTAARTRLAALDAP
jgi:hypothetical protein